MSRSRNWMILLIGGSSGTGKTIAARKLGLRFGVPWAQVDDFRLVLQRVTMPDQQPALHEILADDAYEHTPAEIMRDRLIAVGRVVSNALEIVIANHVATNAPLIIEGDGIVPEMAVQQRFADRDVTHEIRAAFVWEADEQALHENALQRDRGFAHLSPAHQRRQIRQSWLYGQWLRAEALRYGLPVIEARPWTTLAERLLAAL